MQTNYIFSLYKEDPSLGIEALQIINLPGDSKKL